MNYSRLRRRPLWLAALVALVLAALLVAYLLRQYLAEQHERTTAIYQGICEQTATALVAQLRQALASAVLDTLEAMNHVDPAQYRIANVAPVFAAGLASHPYVDRFFLWSLQGPPEYKDEVLFFRTSAPQTRDDIPIRSSTGEIIGSLYRDEEPGRDFLRAARAPENGGRTFVLIERTFGGPSYHVVIHQWGAVLPSRNIVGVIGYTVDLTKVRRRIFGELLTNTLPRVLPDGARSPDLRFSVLDEQQRLVFGAASEAALPSATASLDLSFFPIEIPRAWVADRVTPARWHLVVSAASPDESPATQTYLFVAVMLLLFTAMICAVAINRQSARLAQMHADFVVNVTHQLRTPLSLLAATSETLSLERVRTPEKVKQYAAVLHSQTARLSRLVEQVLRFSRIEAGAGVYEFQQVDLVNLTRTAVDRFVVPARVGAAVRFEGPEGMLPVSADPLAIDEVLANLLENAVKYSNGDIDIVVRVAKVGKEAVVSVKDRGAGIAATDLPHVFDKFYRGSNGGGSSRGFGLGLAIVHDIVRAHRGRVHVESVPNRGSEFSVFLPACGGA
jgi:signal transduction histidine kinase